MRQLAFSFSVPPCVALYHPLHILRDSLWFLCDLRPAFSHFILCAVTSVFFTFHGTRTPPPLIFPVCGSFAFFRVFPRGFQMRSPCIPRAFPSVFLRVPSSVSMYRPLCGTPWVPAGFSLRILVHWLGVPLCVLSSGKPCVTCAFPPAHSMHFLALSAMRCPIFGDYLTFHLSSKSLEYLDPCILYLSPAHILSSICSRYCYLRIFFFS